MLSGLKAHHFEFACFDPLATVPATRRYGPVGQGRKGLDRARCRVACTHTPRTRPPLKPHAKDCTGQTTFAHCEYQHHQLRDPSSAPLIRSPPGLARDPGASGHGWLKRRKRKQARIKSMVSSNRPLQVIADDYNSKFNRRHLSPGHPHGFKPS